MSLLTLEDTFLVLSQLCGEMKKSERKNGFQALYSKLRSFLAGRRSTNRLNVGEHRPILGTGFDNPPGEGLLIESIFSFQDV